MILAEKRAKTREIEGAFKIKTKLYKILDAL